MTYVAARGGVLGYAEGLRRHTIVGNEAMPLQARTFIKTALIYLAVAGLAGGLGLVGQGIGWSALAALRPLTPHLLAVGWATQLIAGVALWMFPPRSRERPRGDGGLAWAAYGALNVGLILRAAAEPLLLWRPAAWLAPMLLSSAVLQALAAWLLVAALWPRVRGRRAAGR